LKCYRTAFSKEPMKANELLACVCTATVLLLASTWVPFFGPFLSVLAPLPFLFYATKEGLSQGVKAVIITILMVGLIGNLSGHPQVIFLSIEFGLLGLILSEIFKRRLSIGRTIFWGTGLMLIIGFAILILISLFQGVGVFELVSNYLQSNLRAAFLIYENKDVDQERLLQLQEYIKIVANIMMKIYPALVILGTGFIVWFNVIASKPLFRLGNLPYPDFGPTDRWRAPEHMVWGLIAAGFSLFLPVGGIKLVGVNALVVMSAIYAFQGFSIVLFYLNKYRVPFWIRFGVYFLIVFQQIFVVGLALAGIFDQWVDFRKIGSRKEHKSTMEDGL